MYACKWHPLRNGMKCILAKKDECSVGTCNPVSNKCNGCKAIISKDDLSVCKYYWNPEAMWTRGNCVRATHIEYVIDEQGRKLDPIKASKLIMGKKAGKKEKRKHLKK